MDKLLVVGTASNVAKTINRDIKIILSAFDRFDEINFFIVESDSSDDTVKKLQELKSTIPKFEFKSVGVLSNRLLYKVARLRYCRNVYVEHVRMLAKNEQPEFVVVADLDGINKSLSKKAVDSCFINSDWGAVAANQSRGYYDICALRANNWQQGDCFVELGLHKANIVNLVPLKSKLLNKIKLFYLYDRARVHAIYSKMKKIPRNSPWIRVDSAFGGLAIYKTAVFLLGDYSSYEDDKDSEHVSFNKKIIANGHAIYINPRLINSHWNEHNLYKYLLVRELRNAIYRSKSLVLIYKSIKKLLKW